MNLKYITCSDPRETVPADDIIKLALSSPITEIAVQAHPSKMSAGMPRNLWFDNIVHIARNIETPINLAVHMNLDWANSICRGQIAPDLLDWFFAQRADGRPVIHRWQINMHGSHTPLFLTAAVAGLIKNNPGREFIFQYGPGEYNRLKKLHCTGVKFAVLYDTSGGRGIVPKRVRAPLFDDCAQGYSGGVSPDNVTDRLENISRVANGRNDIWIDAEGKLKDSHTKQFDVNLAKKYVDAAILWQSKYNLR